MDLPWDKSHRSAAAPCLAAAALSVWCEMRLANIASLRGTKASLLFPDNNWKRSVCLEEKMLREHRNQVSFSKLGKVIGMKGKKETLFVLPALYLVAVLSTEQGSLEGSYLSVMEKASDCPS